MRAETTTREIFTFDELSDDAKETARNEYRVNGLDYEWYDFVIEDSKEIGAILGIDIDKIYFSGFWSQGDGACFEGSYTYKKGARKAIREYATKDIELHEIADNLQALQRPAFYKLYANVKQSGRYMHEYCTDISVMKESNYYRDESPGVEIEEGITEFLRDFMRWIYKRLESEHDYLTSDPAIDETIEANEYEFTSDGMMI